MTRLGVTPPGAGVVHESKLLRLCSFARASSGRAVRSPDVDALLVAPKRVEPPCGTRSAPRETRRQRPQFDRRAALLLWHPGPGGLRADAARAIKRSNIRAMQRGFM